VVGIIYSHKEKWAEHINLKICTVNLNASDIRSIIIDGNRPPHPARRPAPSW